MIIENPCTSAAPCIAGSPVTLTLEVLAPPTSGCPGLPCADVYGLQACDSVTWHFGDGTPDVTVTGQPALTHVYAASGTYRPAVTIANALGTSHTATAFVVASNPPTYVDFSPNDITVPETAGHITFTLVRSGNLMTTAKVHYAHAESWPSPVNQGEAIGGDLTFAPGETTKSFDMKIFDDRVYTGTVSDAVLVTATDGTLFHSNGAKYTLTETDPQPSATVADVRVAEGTETRNTADVVVTLSAPIGVPVTIFGTPSDGTAKFPADYDPPGGRTCLFWPGDTQCVLHFPIVNDDIPESDETFIVTIQKRIADVGPSFARDTAAVTIVNDDAALTPASTQVPTGARVTLKLDIGQPPAAPLTIPLQSSSAEVLEVPASVTIDAGQRTASISAHALKAGLSRVTARVPGMAAPPALVTVVDAITVVADPTDVALRPGGDGVVRVSMQPPRSVAQAMSVWSTRTDVATAPESLTIPANGAATLAIHALAKGVATIWIATADGFSFSVNVTVDDNAVLTRIDPSSAPANGGSAVTLIGEGLDVQCSVAFGSTPAAAVSAAGNGLTVVVPPHAPGAVDVTVVCGAARFTLPRAFTFFIPRRRAAG